MKDDAYKIEVDKDGCERCGLGGTWTIVGPDDCAISTSYDDFEVVSELCERMNEAYEKGRQSK